MYSSYTNAMDLKHKKFKICNWQKCENAKKYTYKQQHSYQIHAYA